MKKVIVFLCDLGKATVGFRKLILSGLGLWVLLRLAEHRADPAYAWAVTIIVVPTAAAVLLERFAKAGPACSVGAESKPDESHE